MQVDITNEQILDLLVEKVASRFYDRDEWDDEYAWHQRIDTAVQEHIMAKIEAEFAATIAPRVDKRIDEMVVQRTSIWGEVKGEKQTLREFIVSRIDGWMSEKVDRNGKPYDGYHRNSARSRMWFLVDKHIGSMITLEVKRAMESATKGIADVLQGAVKEHLQAAAKRIRIDVK
jgi:hypothetical protein